MVSRFFFSFFLLLFSLFVLFFLGGGLNIHMVYMPVFPCSMRPHVCRPRVRLVFMVAFFVVMNGQPLTFLGSLVFIPLAIFFMAWLGQGMQKRRRTNACWRGVFERVLFYMFFLFFFYFSSSLFFLLSFFEGVFL